MSKNRPQFRDFLDSEPNMDRESLIEVERIVVPISQIRRYFDRDKLEQLAESIKAHGILEPLLINKNKELIAGERRLRAAKLVGLKYIPVRVLDVAPDIAKTLAIVENLQREDLNPIEETEGILDLLQLKLNRSREEVISLLYKMNKADDNVIIQDVEIVKKTFDSLGKLKWESFVINRLRLLNLPESILSNIRSGKIEYTKGNLIARIKDEELREKLIQDAIINQLSIKQIKDKIAEYRGKVEIDYDNLSTEELINGIRETYQRFTRSKKIWSNKKNRKKIEQLFKQLQDLIE